MTTQLLTTQQMPYDLMAKSFAAAITRLMPMGGAPLFGLTSMLRDKTCSSFEHGYFTKMMAFPKVTVASGVSITVNGDQLVLPVSADVASLMGNTNANNIVLNDLLVDDQTYELFLVTAISVNDLGSGTITVTRSVGKNANIISDANTGRSVAGGTYPGISGYTTPAAGVSGIPAATGNSTRVITLMHAGNAFPEGSLRPAPVSLLAQRITNYTQILRNSWGVTGTREATSDIAGMGPVAESREDCAAFHALAAERMLFWGQKSLTMSGSNPTHTADGIFNIIKNNASGNITALGADAGGGTTWTSLEAALDKTLQVKAGPKAGNIRQVFCGGTAKRGFTDIVRKNSSMEIVQDGSGVALTSWGLEVTKIRTARGIFELIEHPLFNVYGTSSALAKTAVVLDLDCLDAVYLRKTKEDLYNQNGAVTEGGLDARGGTLTTELTLEVTNPGAFGIMTNINALGVAG